MESQVRRRSARHVSPTLGASLLLSAPFFLLAGSILAMGPEPIPFAEIPRIASRFDQPISLDYSARTSIRDLYLMIAKNSGLSIKLSSTFPHSHLDSGHIEGRLSDVLHTVSLLAGTFHVALDDKTLFVAQDTPLNRRQYEPLAMHTFYLKNADPRDVMTMLRGLADARKITIDRRLAAITVVDTAPKVLLMTELVRRYDQKADEVPQQEQASLWINRGNELLFDGPAEPLP